MPVTIDKDKACITDTQKPVPEIDLTFTYHEYYWRAIFDRQIDLIRRDIARARSEDRLIVYLSCPISARGGGDFSTNVDIAMNTERHVLEMWGEAFWILNPARYQLESKEGLGLMVQHANALDIDLDELIKIAQRPTGGDYMRMWIEVLVQDHELQRTFAAKDGINTVSLGTQLYYRFKDKNADKPALLNSAQHFDGFYFLGPSDVMRFFHKSGGKNATAAIEAHFASKFTTDPDFRDAYSNDAIVWGSGPLDQAATKEQGALKDAWDEQRREFLRFYALRAGVTFSLGSHDEWEIFRLVNLRRQKAYMSPTNGNLGVAEQLGGFFDGKQIDPSAAETPISHGYSVI